jgi:hypothetical protein
VRAPCDGDRYDINQVIADHREGIGKPAISAEGFSRFPCTLLVARCHSRELQAGKAVDCRNVRHLRPACFGVCTDDSDTHFFWGHGSTSLYFIVIDMKLSVQLRRVGQESASLLVLLALWA